MFNGTYEEAGLGGRQYELRNALENPLDSLQRAKAATSLAAGVFSGGEGDSLVVTNGKDLQTPPRISVHVRNGKAASMAGSNAILTNPFGSVAAFATNAREIDAAGARVFPISPMAIFGFGETHIEFRVTLPEGWRAQLPASVTATSEFGTYKSEYAQHGRELVLARTLTGAGGVYPPDRVKALTQWMRDIAKDDARLIVIEKTAAAGGTTP
jgi:hypothetical protein